MVRVENDMEAQEAQENYEVDHNPEFENAPQKGWILYDGENDSAGSRRTKMNPDWQNLLRMTEAYPSDIHRMLPPCPNDRREEVEATLGKMPAALVDMLNQFNGAELFQLQLPLVTIFGVSAIPPLPPLEWAPDWYIDKFTPAWRSADKGRERDWVIAIMNYGGLIILDQNETVREWDTAQAKWEDKTWDFSGWIEDILAEGELYMRES